MYRRISFFPLIIPIAVTAQIDLTNAPVAGTSFQMHVGNYFNVPQTGQGQVWNYSMIGGGGGWTFLFEDASNDPAAGQFPAAELVMTGNGYSNFYTADNSGLYTYGYTSPFGSYVFTDPRRLLKYPLSYGTSWTDPFAAESITGTSTFTGTSTCVANGQGTLVLPWGSVNNVLRVRCATVVDLSAEMQQIDSVTLFYHENFPWHLLKATRQIVYSNGQPLPQNFYLEYASQQSVMNIRQVEDPSPLLFVFPSPANDLLTIGSEHGIDALTICDGMGRALRTVALDGMQRRFEVDVSDLSPGVYSINCICAEERRCYGKFLVQR